MICGVKRARLAKAMVARCPGEPSAGVAALHSAGSLRAASTTSAKVFCGLFGAMMTNIGATPTRAIGVKSAIGSYGALAITRRAETCVDAENSKIGRAHV